MAVHYEIPEGKSAVIDGPANIIVKTGGVPIIGTPVRSAVKQEQADDEEVETASGSKRKRS